MANQTNRKIHWKSDKKKNTLKIRQTEKYIENQTNKFTYRTGRQENYKKNALGDKKYFFDLVENILISKTNILYIINFSVKSYIPEV